MSDDGHARPRRRSRYPEPGSLCPAWWEGEKYERLNAVVAVVATSRHKRTMTDDEVLTVLRQEYGPEAAFDRIGTWRSVTERDIENGDVGEEAYVGGWSEDGSGRAWVTVAYPTAASVHGPLDAV